MKITLKCNTMILYKQWVLAQWQYKNYQFAILGEISAQQSEPDIISIPKTALNIIMMLE